MAKAVGFNRFMAVKSQAGWGTRATGLSTTLIPLRNGAIFDPNPILQPREDAIYTVSPAAQYYTAPKFVSWNASMLFVNPTSAAATVRDLLRAVYGLETLATGPPITKTFTIQDPPIDGGTDTGTTMYGRGLTLHEECVDSTGARIYADSVQDAVVNELSITWRNDAPLLVAARGMASDLKPLQTHISPTIPAGSLFHYRQLKDTVNGGLRMGTANPPTSTDNVIFSQATLTISAPFRYQNFMGNATSQSVSCTANGTTTLTSAALFGTVAPGMVVTGPGVPADTFVVTWASSSSITVNNTVTAGAEPQARVFYAAPEAVLPTRDGQMSITLDVVMDVDNATASQYDAEDVMAHYHNRTGVNVNFLTYIDANNILQFQTTGATAGGFIEKASRLAPGLGAQQFNFRYRVAPNALTDTILKLTTAS